MLPSTGPFSLGDQHLVTIDSLGFGGEGMARLKGTRVVVLHALPGEQVRAEVVRLRPGRAPRLRIREIIRSSPDRRDPNCPWYDGCPGCHLRHVDYDQELQLKRQSVAQALERFAGADPDVVAAVLPAPGRNDYRIRASGSLQGGRITIPGVAPDDPAVCLGECPAQHPEARELLSTVEREAAAKREDCVDDWMTGPPLPRVEVNAALHDGPLGKEARIGDLSLLVGESGWTIPNPSMAAPLREWTLRLLDPAPGEGVVEVGCGVGGLTIPVASRGAQVVAIDTDYRAMQALNRNVERYGLQEQVVVRAGPVEKVWRRLLAAQGAPGGTHPPTGGDPFPSGPRSSQGGSLFSSALCNPMRQPLGPQAMETLVEHLGVKKVVYVGPSPVPAAKDLSCLTDRGWEIQLVQPIDLYPGTYHVLTLALATAPRQAACKSGDDD